MSVKPRREEYTEATRAALLDAAAAAFAAQGYARTSVEDIVRRARLTKGALYHHFKDKTALFEAVFCRIEEGIVQRVVEASAKRPDPWERIDAGLGAFLDAALEPAARRIIFEEAPVALGWARWRARAAVHDGRAARVARALHEAGLVNAEPSTPSPRPSAPSPKPRRSRRASPIRGRGARRKAARPPHPPRARAGTPRSR
jgi:AcrR family transcriptional regulator